MKISWHGIAAFATSLLGVALSPAVLGVLSPHTAAIVTAAGIVYQAVTQPAAQSAPPATASPPVAPTA